jgi:hypothetical protein
MIPRFNSELEGFVQFLAQVETEYLDGATLEQIRDKYELSPAQFSSLMDRFATHPRCTEALAETQLVAGVIPIFWSSGTSERVKQLGSGVLLRLPYSVFLLTAAHVTDSWSTGHLFVPGERHIVPLSGGFSYWKPSAGQPREADNIDIAYIRLSKSTRSRLHSSFRDITLDEISYKGSVESVPFATFVGYPVTKGRRQHGVLSSERLTYTGHVWSKDVYDRLGYSRERHVCVRMRTKHTFSSLHGRKLIAPSPRGVSGGAILSWPTHFEDRGTGGGLRLIGIAHSFDAASHCLSGTHIEMYVNAIAHNDPKLRRSIQRAIQKASRTPLV